MTDELAPQMDDEPDWPTRVLILMAVGAGAALAIRQLMDVTEWAANRGAGRDAWATGIGVGAMAFGFGLSRVRIAWTVIFAAVLGVVAGLIVWGNGQPGGLWSWSGASMVLAIAIAVPLFQVARDEGRASFPYTQVHGHAWTNVVLWGACWGFTGIALLLSHLLGELFALIGINVLKDVLNKSWSNALIIGAAFGGALALLRDRDRVVRLLQRVVTSVLGVLAPVLGVALILFIMSLPFTGLNNLWEATKSTTPILLACVIGALILANAVIGHGSDDEAKNPVLRWSALALGVAILPLAMIAALAMGLRLDQYGLTPDRLWGLVCVVFAVGYGLIYFVAAVRKRLDWAPMIRRDNIRLAFATMAVALLLATPLVGFNAISASNQVARLKSGKVTVDKFDWAALAFDFGAPGKRALAGLQQSTVPAIANRAAEVAKAEDRYQVIREDRSRQEAAALAPKLRVLPVPVALPEGLRAKVAEYDACGGSSTTMCIVLYRAGAAEAWAIQAGCFFLPTPAKPAKSADGDVVSPTGEYLACSPQRFVLTGDKWATPTVNPVQPADKTTAPARKAALDAGQIEVRAVRRRQLFIGQEPVGDPFE